MMNSELKVWMFKTVEIPEDIALRMVKFIDAAAGDGIWFRDMEDIVDELDSAMILFDWVKQIDKPPVWWPQKMREDWQDNGT